MLRSFMQLHKFYRGFDGAAQCLEQAIGKPSCIPHCGKCCHNNVKCMTIEALNATSILTGIGKLDKALSIAEGWLLERHQVAPTYEGVLSGCYLPAKIFPEFANLSSSQCPFLNETKECVVHEARPLVCRAYGITRSGQGCCPRPLGHGETDTRRTYIPATELRDDIDRFRVATEKRNPSWTVSGFFPTLLFRVARPDKFRQMVDKNQIATAKLIGTQADLNLMWQPQMDDLLAGISPDAVVAKDEMRRLTLTH